MPTTNQVKETVKETLLGVEEEAQLSQSSRFNFLQHAVQDEASGDYYMGPDQFINAIAPSTEDYVCSFLISVAHSSLLSYPNHARVLS